MYRTKEILARTDGRELAAPRFGWMGPWRLDGYWPSITSAVAIHRFFGRLCGRPSPHLKTMSRRRLDGWAGDARTIILI
jgi:hypothetical protein